MLDTIAYEWTKVNNGATLHKNVIFAGDKVPASPFDSRAHPTHEQLWQALASGCGTAGGCEALTIPHNSNQSQGTTPRPALYYARIVEAPTPRWSSYDCDKAPAANPECVPGGALKTMIQERAWTSPIWRNP